DPAPLAKPEGWVVLKGQGEFSVAGVRIGERKMRGRTSFAEELELPVEALGSLHFPKRKVDDSAAVDWLVFKNGDELAGELVAAASDARLSWRLRERRQVNFELRHLAGVHLAPLAARELGEGLARLELRKGDCIRGVVEGFDEAGLRLRHSQLGVLEASRET